MLRGLEKGPELRADRCVLGRIAQLGKSVRDSDAAEDSPIPEAPQIGEPVIPETAGETADEPPKQVKRAQAKAFEECARRCSPVPNVLTWLHFGTPLFSVSGTRQQS